jgi:hypothetical protein
VRVRSAGTSACRATPTLRRREARPARPAFPSFAAVEVVTPPDTPPVALVAGVFADRDILAYASPLMRTVRTACSVYMLFHEAFAM